MFCTLDFTLNSAFFARIFRYAKTFILSIRTNTEFLTRRFCEHPLKNRLKKRFSGGVLAKIVNCFSIRSIKKLKTGANQQLRFSERRYLKLMPFGRPWFIRKEGCGVVRTGSADHERENRLDHAEESFIFSESGNQCSFIFLYSSRMFVAVTYISRTFTSAKRIS